MPPLTPVSPPYAPATEQLPPRRQTGLYAGLAKLFQLLLSARARGLRFAFVGGLCGLLQILLLVGLKLAGLHAIAANIAAYLLSAQVNFLLSNRFIWHDRWSRRATAADLLRRWLSFHGSIAGTFVLSQLVFIAGRLYLPDVLASTLGIGVAALVNFAVQDRLTFKRIPGSGSDAPAPEGVLYSWRCDASNEGRSQ